MEQKQKEESHSCEKDIMNGLVVQTIVSIISTTSTSTLTFNLGRTASLLFLISFKLLVS